MSSFQILAKEVLINKMKKNIPVLTSSLHKGESGRIGVVGGSLEYTGAPYFAAISALRAGCDLVHVFCRRKSAPVIKSYSPELIVHPLLDAPNALEEISQWLPRMHALVLGPGLGRDPTTFEKLEAIIEIAKKLEIPMVIDADGLFFINSNYKIIHECKNVVLTPNAIEFSRLYQAVMSKNEPALPATKEQVAELATMLGNITILYKTEKDIITNGNEIYICEKMGSPRRCGGQGDLASGMLATFLFWAMHDKESPDATLAAAAAAAHLSRSISKKAFEMQGRGTLATDMIPFIPVAFRELFGQE